MKILINKCNFYTYYGFWFCTFVGCLAWICVDLVMFLLCRTDCGAGIDMKTFGVGVRVHVRGKWKGTKGGMEVDSMRMGPILANLAHASSSMGAGAWVWLVLDFGIWRVFLVSLWRFWRPHIYLVEKSLKGDTILVIKTKLYIQIWEIRVSRFNVGLSSIYLFNINSGQRTFL